jgi:hypothetical protein
MMGSGLISNLAQIDSCGFSLAREVPPTSKLYIYPIGYYLGKTTKPSLVKFSMPSATTNCTHATFSNLK